LADQTIRVPIDLRNPIASSLAGNSFFNVTGLTALDLAHWEFVKDVEGKIYGVVGVPTPLAATPNAKIILQLAANATTGVSTMQVSSKAVADAESFNPGSLDSETAEDVTMPSTAYDRKEVSISLTNAPEADDILLVEIFHDGDAANDTLAVNTLLVAAYLEIDVTGV